MSATNAGTELNVPESSVPLTRRQIRERELALQAPVEREESVGTPEPVVAEVAVSSPEIVAESVTEHAPETVTLSKPVAALPEPSPAVAVEPIGEPDLEDAVVVLDEPYAVPVAKIKDSSLPSLFGDDPEEEKDYETPVVAASYAREAPEAKYLSDDQPRRIVLPYAPEPTFAHAAPRQYSPMPVAHTEEWNPKAKMQVVVLSVLYVGLSLTQVAIYLLDLISQINASGTMSM